MSRKHRRGTEEEPTRREPAPERRASRTFYWAMGLVAAAGAALLVASLRMSADRTPRPFPSPTAEAVSAPQSAGFPAEYDSLGVSLGARDAPVVVREFADYQCPGCAGFAPVSRALRGDYVESSQVRFVLFDFPLTHIHPNALAAAQAARCAGEQGKHWSMHDRLFERQRQWSGAEDPMPLFSRYAAEIGLDVAAFNTCVLSGRQLEAVRRSAAFAQAIGVRSTPTVVVGDVPLGGVPSYADVAAEIERQLASRSASVSDPR